MAATASLGTAVLRVRADVTGAILSLNTLVSSMGRIGARLTSVGRNLTFFGTLAAGGFGKAVAAGVLFEDTMARVRTKSLEDTTEQFEAMQAAAIEAGRTTRFTAIQAAEGLFKLREAGFGAAQAIAILPNGLNLAQAGGIQVGRAMEIAANTLKQFGLGAESAERVMDALAIGAANSNSSLEEMAQALKFAGQGGRAMKSTVEDVIAAIGAMSNAALKSGIGGRSLRQFFAKTFDFQGAGGKKLESINNKLKKLGLTIKDLDIRSRTIPQVVESIILSSKEMRKVANSLQAEGKNLFDELTRLEEGGKGTNEAFEILGRGVGLSEQQIEAMIVDIATLSSLFSVRATASVFTLAANFGRMNLILRKTAENAKEGGGAMKTMADVMEDTVLGSLFKLISRLSTLSIVSFFESRDELKAFVDALTESVDKMIEWVKLNPKITNTLAKVTGGVIALTVALGVLGLVSGLALQGLSLLLTPLAFFINTLGGFIGVPALIVLIAVFGLLSIAINENKEAILKWLKESEAVKNLITSVKAFFSAIGVLGKEIFRMGEIMGVAFLKFLFPNDDVADFADFLVNKLAKAVVFVTDVLRGLIVALSLIKTPEQLAGFFTSLGVGVVKFLRDSFLVAKDFLQSGKLLPLAATFATSFINGLSRAFGTLFPSLEDGFRDFLFNMFNVVFKTPGGFKKFGSALSELFSTAFTGVSSLFKELGTGIDFDDILSSLTLITKAAIGFVAPFIEGLKLGVSHQIRFIKTLFGIKDGFGSIATVVGLVVVGFIKFITNVQIGINRLLKNKEITELVFGFLEQAVGRLIEAFELLGAELKGNGSFIEQAGQAVGILLGLALRSLPVIVGLLIGLLALFIRAFGAFLALFDLAEEGGKAARVTFDEMLKSVLDKIVFVVQKAKKLVKEFLEKAGVRFGDKEQSLFDQIILTIIALKAKAVELLVSFLLDAKRKLTTFLTELVDDLEPHLINLVNTLLDVAEERINAFLDRVQAPLDSILNTLLDVAELRIILFLDVLEDLFKFRFANIWQEFLDSLDRILPQLRSKLLGAVPFGVGTALNAVDALLGAAAAPPAGAAAGLGAIGGADLSGFGGGELLPELGAVSKTLNINVANSIDQAELIRPIANLFGESINAAGSV